jgi:hypothetical protein
MSDFKPSTFKELLDEANETIERLFGPFPTFEIDQVRRVEGLGSLFLLISKEGDEGEWLCEDLRSGHSFWVPEDLMGEEVFNEMEVLAWAAQ